MELRRRLHLDGDRVGACCESEARGAVRAVQDVDGVRGGARVAQGGAGVEAVFVVSGVCGQRMRICARSYGGMRGFVPGYERTSVYWNRQEILGKEYAAKNRKHSRLEREVYTARNITLENISAEELNRARCRKGNRRTVVRHNFILNKCQHRLD